MALLSIVFTGSSSPQFGLGYTLGKIVISVAVAIPIYLLVRYFSAISRNMNRLGQINLLSILTATVWTIQIVAAAVVPGFISAHMERTASELPRNVGPTSSVRKLPDGASDWSQFTPVDKPKSATGCRASDDRLTNCLCIRNVEGQKLEPWQLPWQDTKKLVSLIAQCVCAGEQVDLNDQSCVRAILVPGTKIQ